MINHISAKEGESYLEYLTRIKNSRPNEKINIGQDLHHIIPQSRGGSNNEENLIYLYRSEHAKAHQLYSDEHPEDDGLAMAAYMLSHKDNTLLTDDEMNRLAERNAINSSKRNSGENNPMYGKHHSEESKQKNSEHNKGKQAGEKNPMYGVHMCGEQSPRWHAEISQEQRIKQSNAMKGKYVGEDNPTAVSVVCIETNQEFGCLKDAANWCGLKHPSDITNHIKGNKQSAGKHPITHQKLHWKITE